MMPSHCPRTISLIVSVVAFPLGYKVGLPAHTEISKSAITMNAVVGPCVGSGPLWIGSAKRTSITALA